MNILKFTLAAILATIIAAGCMSTSTAPPASNPVDVAAERERQMELAVKTRLERIDRLWTAAYPILRSNVDLCDDKVDLMSGSLFNTIHELDRKHWAVAERLGFTSQPTITLVIQGSPAHDAGVRAGDVIVAVNGKRVPTVTSKRSSAKVMENIKADTGLGDYTLTVLRDGSEIDMDISPLPVCDYNVVMVDNDGLNAFADGESIYVTVGMLRFLQSDTELQAVVAHELAHNTEGHIKKQKVNTGIGAFFGAVLDVAAATQGIRTDFTSNIARFASMRFSQDFEREADYVGVYMMERSGIDSSEVADLWRKMAIENAASISFGRSHPTTAERFVNLDAYSQEARNKRLNGEALMPKRGKESR